MARRPDERGEEVAPWNKNARGIARSGDREITRDRFCFSERNSVEFRKLATVYPSPPPRENSKHDPSEHRTRRV